MSKPVVLLAEELTPATVDALGPDFEIRHCNGADRAELLAAIRDVDAILIRSATKVDAEAIAAANKLKVVARAGVGLDNVDVSAATKAGVMVVNAPTSNIVTAAELACGLIIATARNIPQAGNALKNGEWKRSKYTGVELAEKTLGVVGLGRIGLAFAERAAAFGTTVYAVAKPDRSAETLDRAAGIGVRFVDDLPTLARTCDVLSLHLPATDGTRHLVDSDLLEHVRPGTPILNTARGDLIDEDALIAAVEDKDVRAGLDVFADEPGTATGAIDSRLARHPNVIGTHHVGASTEQAQQAVADEVVRMVAEFESGSVLHCVNLDRVRQPQPTTGPGDPS